LHRSRYKEGFINAASTGFFFILLGTIFITTPNLFDKVLDFFQDFEMVNVPNFGDVVFPAPASPATHTTVYLAAKRFCFVWGLFSIGILLLRIFAGSPLKKKAETASKIVFWLGASTLINIFLTKTATIAMWFAFWAAIIMLIGFSLVIRAFILAVAKA